MLAQSVLKIAEAQGKGLCYHAHHFLSEKAFPVSEGAFVSTG